MEAVTPSMPPRASAIAWREASGQRLARTAAVRPRLSEISAMETSTLARTSSGAPAPETTRSMGAPILAATRALKDSSGLPATSVKSEPSMMTTSCSRATAR